MEDELTPKIPPGCDEGTKDCLEVLAGEKEAKLLWRCGD